jgi:uncharacterized membrane protein
VRLGVPVPLWALLLIGAAIVALAIAAYRRPGGLTPGRRAALVALRIASLALVVLCLLRPLTAVPPDVREDGLIAVLVDVSRSMGIRDADGLERVERAGALVSRTIVPELTGRYRLESFVFGDRLAAGADAALVATGDRTDLAAAVDRVVERSAGRGLAGLVVVSDGNDTSGADLGEAGARAGVPVLAVGVGGAGSRDREIVAVSSGQSALDASLVDLTATIGSRGIGGAFAVRLLQNGQVVGRRLVTPAAAGAPSRVVFTVAPDRVAPTLYTVDVPEAEGEATAGNNRAQVLVAPPGRVRLILSLEGAPGFEHTFLKRAWSDDPSLEVDSVVRKGRNELGEDTYLVQAGASRSEALVSGFPATREALYAYDAVVLANYDVHTLTQEQLERLRDFASERGGGVLFVGARTFERQSLGGTPLEELLPLRLGGVAAVLPASSAAGATRVQPTPEGERHPLMRIAATDEETRERWTALPALAAVVPLGTPRPGASVLAVTDAGGRLPVIAVQRFGAGRTAVFAGEASWRWKMMRPADDPSYDRFWRQMARWLGGDTAELLSASVPASVLPGEAVALKIAARTPEFEPAAGADVRVTIEGPDGIGRPVVAALEDSSRGLFTAPLPPAERGIYRAIVERGDLSGPGARTELRWLVGGVDRELTDPWLNTDGLRRLAERAGGRYVTAGEVREGVEWLASAARVPDGPVEWRDAWHTGWMFALIVLLTTSEWMLRRRWGLR